MMSLPPRMSQPAVRGYIHMPQEVRPSICMFPGDKDTAEVTRITASIGGENPKKFLGFVPPETNEAVAQITFRRSRNRNSLIHGGWQLIAEARVSEPNGDQFCSGINLRLKTGSSTSLYTTQWQREEEAERKREGENEGRGNMCIASWIWQAHPLYPFLLVLNRDEYHDRPTKPVGWWGEGSRKILGGKDVVAGGTWLGCTRNGRLAFLTNVLEPDAIPTAQSRGNLPVKFLECGKSPLEFAEEVANEADQYNGFNLVLVDLCSKTMVYVSNRPKGEPISIELVSSGLHVLTNAGLDTPWQKALRLGKSFKELLYKYDGEEIPARDMVEQMMRDKAKADRDHLPNTGCDPDWELNLSSVFVEVDTELGRYGTRSTIVLAVKKNGEVDFYETYLEMGAWKEHTVEYQIGR